MVCALAVSRASRIESTFGCFCKCLNQGLNPWFCPPKGVRTGRNLTGVARMPKKNRNDGCRGATFLDNLVPFRFREGLYFSFDHDFISQQETCRDGSNFRPISTLGKSQLPVRKIAETSEHRVPQ